VFTADPSERGRGCRTQNKLEEEEEEKQATKSNMNAVSGRVNELAERREEAQRKLSDARRALKRAAIERQTAENKVSVGLTFLSQHAGWGLV
jgi:chromosome segregation ATPase